MSAKASPVRLLWVVWAAVLTYAVYKVLLYPFSVSPQLAFAILGLSVLILLFAALPSLRILRATPPPPPSAGSYALSGAVAAVAILSVVVGFTRPFIGYGVDEPPPSITDVTDPRQFDSVLAYAHRVQYDSVTHGTADSALLTDTSRGILDTVTAWIAPARGANFNSYGDFGGVGRGRGRVVARIRVNTGTSHGYPLLNLPPGVSYVWVDSLDVRDTSGTFRALIIPDQPGRTVVRFPVSRDSRYIRSHHTFANYPMARWVLHHSGCTNVPCGQNGCCQSCPK